MLYGHERAARIREVEDIRASPKEEVWWVGGNLAGRKDEKEKGQKVVECPWAERLVPSRKCTLTTRDAFDRRQPRSTANFSIQVMSPVVRTIDICRKEHENMNWCELTA